MTSPFASVVTDAHVALPPGFEPDFDRREPLKAMPVKYSHARVGLLRRPLEIPNPVLHFLLCDEISKHWGALQPHLCGTPLSASHPVLSPAGRAVESARPQSARQELAAQTRLNQKYILKTDISNFYNSIYTHSVPWALHTKAVAKANRGMRLLGNRLDYLLRNGQDGQTIGVPIGPDTSLIIAEILMQTCDKALLAALPNVRGYRFIDDYELGFRDRTEAEQAFHYLEKVLSTQELSLNPRKTEILRLPCNIDAPWVGPLQTFTFRATPAGQRGDIIRFFDLAFELQARYGDEAVLQYAVARLRSLDIHPSNWGLFQRLLLDCAAPEPAALSFVLEAIIRRANAGAQPAVDDIEEVVNTLISCHSELTHSSEVAWALWACLVLGIRVSREAVDAVSHCEDSVVALLALHCEVRGLLSAPLDKGVWLCSMNAASLYQEHWLMSYEANVKGWLPSQGGGDHVRCDENFRFLKSAGVSFYDETLAAPPAPGAPAALPHPIPVTPGAYDA